MTSSLCLLCRGDIALRRLNDLFQGMSLIKGHMAGMQTQARAIIGSQWMDSMMKHCHAEKKERDVSRARSYAGSWVSSTDLSM